MHKLLKTYLKRLTNLTANNKSLVLLRLTEQFVDLHDLDFAQMRPSFDIIKDLMARKEQIQICDLVNSRDEDSNRLSKRIKRLSRTEKFIYEESGTRDLYVGWPFIRGKFNDGSIVSCPLLFFPVEIELEGNQWILKQREEVNVTFNKSFLLAYGQANQIKISDELIDRVFDDFDTDSTVFRTALYQVLKESPLDINFNRENFEDKLQPFQSFRKNEFVEQTKDGEVKLFPNAVLGIFPQAGSNLVPDYLEMIDRKEFQDIDEFFESRSKMSAKRIREEEIITPFRLDAYQEDALIKVKQGNSVVVQGPPGTGKSQLICNIISDCVANKKSVLLVSQKRAALDVVQKRLEEIGLGSFFGLVHDYKNDRKILYEKIARQINKTQDYEIENNGLDFIYLEREFTQNSRNIDNIVELLEEYKFALFDESECGISAKELYLSSDINAPSIDIRQEYKHFNSNTLGPFESKLNTYIQYHNKFDLDTSTVRNRKPFIGYSVSDLQKIKEILKDIPKFQKEIETRLINHVGKSMEFDVAQYLLNRKEEIEAALEELSDPKVFQFFLKMIEYPDRATDKLWLANEERVLLDCFKGSGIERFVAKQSLGKFQEILERAINARKNPWSYLKWSLFSKEKYMVKRAIVANELSNNKKGFAELIKKIDNRLNLEHNLTELKETEWLLDIPDSYEKIGFQNWFHLQKIALKVKLILNSVRNLGEYIKLNNPSFDDLKSDIDILFNIIEKIPVQKVKWNLYLSNSEISAFLFDQRYIESFEKYLDKNFEEICDFDSFKKDLSSQEERVISKIISEFEDEVDAEKCISLFDNSVKIAWIEHIETKYPVLRSAGTIKFYNWISEIRKSFDLKSEISREIMMMKAREGIYENIEFNRLNNPVTYRDVQHQVNKKRRIWPMRKLLANFSREVFNLIPCWMASPESVSAIFPMERVFDVVIFDEASQCFAERGIPAMYRGSQIVIAGDSKQLQPNDLYSIRWEDEDNDEIGAEVTSLLDLSSVYLENIPLKEHYRSKSPDLIDFSNSHFYEDSLKVLPDKETVLNGSPGIEYVKVEGIWSKNTNYIEAVEVVGLIDKLTSENANKSIGIVTFNIHQQSLILDLLDEKFLGRKEIPNDLFVKNIENVQGDERDIIIFSIGYGYNEQGKLNLKFGSLNLDGGENRLNVAITRAKEKIFIISSLMPDEMKTEELKNSGPKLLKEYLKYGLLVSNGGYKPVPSAPTHNNKSWYLKYRLMKIQKDFSDSLLIDEVYPFSDLTILYKNELAGLIFTDDDQYFNSKSVKDAFVYTHNLLMSKDWTYRQYFSRKFWMEKSEIREELVRYIAQNTPADAIKQIKD